MGNDRDLGFSDMKNAWKFRSSLKFYDKVMIWCEML